VSDPLAKDTAVIGGGSVDLWLQSTASDTDLQVTLSEVRPDGKEVFVQNGWLRASERKLARGSTELEPRPTGFKSDVQPLPAGQWSEVRVPLYYSGHVFRAGSRIRISVEAPGGDQPFWAFATLQPQGTVTNTIARTPVYASNLVLPVVSGVNVPTGVPPCPGLRGEPCRAYVPFTNTPAS
jgi:putative CocE/NonD family hydrolase